MSRTLRALPVGRLRNVNMYKGGVYVAALCYRRMRFIPSGVTFTRRSYPPISIERMRAQGGVFVENRWGWQNVNSFCYLETVEEVQEYVAEQIMLYTRKNRTSYRQRMHAVKNDKRHANHQTRQRDRQDTRRRIEEWYEDAY